MFTGATVIAVWIGDYSGKKEGCGRAMWRRDIGRECCNRERSIMKLCARSVWTAGRVV